MPRWEKDRWGHSSIFVGNSRGREMRGRTGCTLINLIIELRSAAWVFVFRKARARRWRLLRIFSAGPSLLWAQFNYSRVRSRVAFENQMCREIQY